ncbi:hypothetical protein PTTG_00433 [Puccinia triticina 1-1 BBBD Race 1]|uniref:Uncharacterized protein n=1 Tax=Puccinia triticina (isolate 1-1 / race 1 (BBBD)) TaxID=630390 RepID=A0A180H2L5_PUCT1|nr:hypothetical protein PTTG_00433 [Puccinia triticina 1-1 BBBD Race 1]
MVQQPPQLSRLDRSTRTVQIRTNRPQIQTVNRTIIRVNSMKAIETPSSRISPRKTRNQWKILIRYIPQARSLASPSLIFRARWW